MPAPARATAPSSSYSPPCSCSQQCSFKINRFKFHSSSNDYPDDSFLGFPGSALRFLWLPEPWLTSYKKLHSVPFQQSFSLQGASLVAQLVKKIRLQCGRPGFDPSVGRIPRRRERLPTPVSWPGEFQGPYSPKSQTRLSDFHWVYSINTKLCVYPHNVALTFRRDTHTMLCVQRSPARASRTRQTLPPTYGSYLPCYTP